MPVRALTKVTVDIEVTLVVTAASFWEGLGVNPYECEVLDVAKAFDTIWARFSRAALGE